MNRSRIATLVRIRSLQERVARSNLTQSRAALLAASNAETRVWMSIDTVGSAFGPLGVPAVLSARESVIDQGVRAAEAAATETGLAHAQVESAQQVWSAAARREEALERLFERVVSGEEAELARAAANELDDLVAAAHVRAADVEVGL
jgi:flagellar export protein FliJ